MKFTFKQLIVPNFWKRFCFMITAICLVSFFLSILIEIGFGTDSSSFTLTNVGHITGLGLGPVQSIFYGILLVITFFLAPELIGIATFINMFAIGFIVDFFHWIWQNVGFIEFLQNCSLLIKISIFAISIINFVFFVAVYITSNLGIASYDAIPKIISNHLPKVPFFFVRICYDFSIFAIGVIVGITSKDGIQGSVIGSIVMSLLLGPVISFVGKKLGKLIQ